MGEHDSSWPLPHPIRVRVSDHPPTEVIVFFVKVTVPPLFPFVLNLTRASTCGTVHAFSNMELVAQRTPVFKHWLFVITKNSRYIFNTD